ncbi:MAG: hypothetical protein JW910_21460, partial [Anaerolineae bacterium]|nr:hypothetical protein [Anaerolineae bacterium]
MVSRGSAVSVSVLSRGNTALIDFQDLVRQSYAYQGCGFHSASVPTNSPNWVKVGYNWGMETEHDALP